MSDETIESWLVGVTAAGEQLASLRVHAGYVAAGPAAGMPTRVHLRLRLLAETPSGFPGPDEAVALQEAEARIVQALGGDSVLVAVVGARGFRDLVLHSADVDALRAAIDRCVLVDLGYEPEVDADEDPSWSAYRALFGQAVDADYDRRLVARLAAAGLDLSEPRPVRHFLGFDELDDAYGLIAALQAAGIDADLEDSTDSADSAGVAGAAVVAALAAARASGRTIVVVREVAEVSQLTAARSRAGLAELAGSWGGVYQGWTADEDGTSGA